jgi:heat shock protein HslJ
LHADGRFERTLAWLERSVAPRTESGTFSWNTAGSAVTLQDPDGGSQQLKVGENTLIALDRDGNPIGGERAGHYVLHKHLRDPAIEGRKWTLTELRGTALDTRSASQKPFLILDGEQALASGNASCNSFSGAYAIKSGNRISIDENLAVTMMACADMSLEEAFLEVLRQVDNYSIAGGVLSLNRARMAPLARFEAVGGI